MKKLLFILLFLPILSQGQLLYGDSLQLTGVVGTGIRNIGVTENGVLIEYSNTVEKSDDLKALTGSNDLTYISPEKLVEVIKMLSFQNFGQLEDVYAPTITLTIDSLKVGLANGEAFIESGTLKSKISSSGFTGLINGVNKTFILEGIPKDLDIYLNGVYQVLNKDFTLSGTSVIFVKVPYSIDEITIKYAY